MQQRHTNTKPLGYNYNWRSKMNYYILKLPRGMEMGKKNCGIQSFSYVPNVTSYACKGERECLVPFSFLWSLEQLRLCDILTLSNTHIIPIWKLFWSFHDIKRDRWGIGSLDPLLVYSLPPLRIRLLKWSGLPAFIGLHPLLACKVTQTLSSLWVPLTFTRLRVLSKSWNVLGNMFTLESVLAP